MVAATCCDERALVRERRDDGLSDAPPAAGEKNALAPKLKIHACMFDID
jgi:hypothetical protein